MQLHPTAAGGRIAKGDTPWGAYAVEWTAAGRLVSHSIEIRTPPGAGAAPAPVAPGDEGCSPCEQARRLREAAAPPSAFDAWAREVFQPVNP